MRVDMTLICQRTERRLFPIKAAMLRLPQKAGVIVDSYDRCVENIDSNLEQKSKEKHGCNGTEQSKEAEECQEETHEL